MLYRLVCFVTMLTLLQPTIVLAQLSSENFVVDSPSISAPNTTNAGTSTNFQTEQESGGLYIYDAPAAPTGGGGGGGSQTRVVRDNTPSSAVLGKLDSITICHSGNGKKYVALSNVQVFITLAESGLNAELRGHDGHGFDIIPQFQYDLGDGVKTYPGQNWTSENQLLHANSCALFLAEPEPEPTPTPTPTPTPEPVTPEPPVPPVVAPVDVCRDQSRTVNVETAVDEQTLVTFTIPKGAARSKAIEKNKSDYRLLVQVKAVGKERAAFKQKQIENALRVLERKATKPQGNSTPYGLVKKLSSQSTFVAPKPTFDTPTVSGGLSVVTIGNPDCDDVITPPDAPTDPTTPTTPPAPNGDEDGDGIPNETDPDDNNDGIPDDPRQAIITAHKIVCEDESLLPDWGNRGGPKITRTTAQTWVDNTPGCSFESGWFFEWGEQSVRNPGDNTIGTTGRGWNVIGPTNASGMAYTTVTNEQILNNRHFWFREVNKPNYLGYTYRYGRNSYSAEMYCHTDVLNYDNFDRIDGIKTNNSFNCIAWNVRDTGTAPPDDGVTPEPDSDSDGVPDVLDENDGFPDEDSDGDGIPDSTDPNPDTTDTDGDGDGLPDVVDEDDDNDGIPDETDTENNNPPVEPENPPVDTDGDGVFDEFDDEIIIVVDDDADFTDDDLDIILGGDGVTPIEISVVDETGTPIDSFEEPITIDIFNPGVAGAEDVVVLQPSENENEWYVLPAEINGDSVTVTLRNPGEIFIWLLTPGVAQAAEGDDEGFFSSLIPPFLYTLPTIELNKFLLDALTLIGFWSVLVLTFLQLSAAPFSVTHWIRNVVLSAQKLFALITFQKKKRPWGTVYDIETKAPLDPALLELFDATGNKIDQAITDLDGRYGFLAPVGNYTLTAKKTNYNFPSRTLLQSEHDVLYDDLYYGGPLVVSDAVTADIPMDPVGFDWNQYEKLRTRQTRFFKRLDPFLVRALDFFSIVGVVLLLWQAVSIPTFISFMFLAAYLVMVWRRFSVVTPLLYGFVFENEKPVPYALIRIFVGEQEVGRKVADEFGRYFILVAPGKYTVEVNRPTGNAQYEPVLRQAVKARRGVINEDLRSA